jgi:hypothetical protein
LRTVRVMKAANPAFFSKLALAVRTILGLPTPSVQNVTVCYTDLIRNGVLRNVIQTVVKTPLFNEDDLVLQETPLRMPGNDRAFCRFEDVPEPTYIDIFFYTMPEGFGAEPSPLVYDFAVYLGHTIIGGPVGGLPYTGVQPPVPVEPPAPPAPVP